MAAPLHSPDGHYAHIATERNSASLDETLLAFERGPLAAYMPYNENTASILRGLADLKPATLATMHGTSFAGDGERALLDLNSVLRETLSHPMCDSLNWLELWAAVR